MFGPRSAERLFKPEIKLLPIKEVDSGEVEVMAAANQGKVWDPFVDGHNVENCGIGDSAAQIHNTSQLDDVVGKIRVKTVTGTQDKSLGTTVTTFGIRDAVETNKEIVSLPQALMEKDIVGWSNFKELPSEIAIGSALYQKQANGSVKAFPTTAVDEIMQIPIDLKEARDQVKPGIIHEVQFSKQDYKSAAPELNVDSVSIDGTFDFQRLSTRLKSKCKQMLGKQFKKFGLKNPSRVWLKSSAAPRPPPVSKGTRAVDITLDEKLKPLCFSEVDTTGLSGFTFGRFLRLFFDAGAAEPEHARSVRHIPSARFVNSTELVAEPEAEPDIDLSKVLFKEFTIAQLKENGVYIDDDPCVAVDNVLLDDREKQYWEKHDITKGEHEARRQHRILNHKLIAQRHGEEAASEMQRWGDEDDYTKANMVRTARTGDGEPTEDSHWFTDMSVVTVVGSRQEKACSFWVTGKSGFPVAHPCKDKTSESCAEGYNEAKRILVSIPCVVTPDGANVFEGGEFAAHLAKDEVSLEPTPPHCQNLNKAEPKWKIIKRLTKVILTRKHGRFPKTEWPAAIRAACWVEALFCGAVARRFGPEAEARMINNIATTGREVWVKDFTNPGDTFQTQGKRAVYLHPCPKGIMYAVPERSGDGRIRLSVPMISNSFKISHTKWFYPDAPFPGPKEIFGELAPNFKIRSRLNRGRPPKEMVEIATVEIDAVATEAASAPPPFEPSSPDEPWYVAMPVGKGSESSIDGEGNVFISDGHNEDGVTVDVVESLSKKRAMSSEPLGTHAKRMDGKVITFGELTEPAWDRERVHTFDANQSFGYLQLIPEELLREECVKSKTDVIVELYCTIFGLKYSEYRNHPTMWKKCKTKIRCVVHWEYSIVSKLPSNGRVAGEVYRTVSISSSAVQYQSVNYGYGSNKYAFKADTVGAYPTAFSGGKKRYAKPPDGFIAAARAESPEVDALCKKWEKMGYTVNDLVCPAPKANYGAESAGFYFGSKEDCLKSIHGLTETRQGLYIRNQQLEEAVEAFGDMSEFDVGHRYEQVWDFKFQKPTNATVVYLSSDEEQTASFQVVTDRLVNATNVLPLSYDDPTWINCRARIIFDTDTGEYLARTRVVTSNKPVGDVHGNKMWPRIAPPDNGHMAAEEVSQLVKPKGVPCGPDIITQYVDDDSVFVSKLQTYIRLAASRNAPITVDDLRSETGSDVLGVSFMCRTWTEAELGVDVRPQAIEQGCASADLLEPSDETITLTIQHQIPLKTVTIKDFVDAGGKLLRKAPLTPLPPDWEPGRVGAPPGVLGHLVKSLNGKNGYIATHTHQFELLRAFALLGKASSFVEKKEWTTDDDDALTHLMSYLNGVRQHCQWAIVSSREIRHGLLATVGSCDSSQGSNDDRTGESAASCRIIGRLGITRILADVAHERHKKVRLSSAEAELHGGVMATKLCIRAVEVLQSCTGKNTIKEYLYLDANSAIRNLLAGLSEALHYTRRVTGTHTRWVTGYWAVEDNSREIKHTPGADLVDDAATKGVPRERFQMLYHQFFQVNPADWLPRSQ